MRFAGGDGMELDKSELDNRMFDGFASGSKDRYVYVCNMRTGVSRWSKNAVEYFGLSGEYMKDAGLVWAEYIHYEDRDEYMSDIEAVFAGEKDKHELEYRVRNKEGDYDVCTCRGSVIKGENGGADLFVGTIEKHGIMDNVDATTNLYNIYEFWRAMRHCKEIDREVTVLMISINGFTAINDTYGYTFGNKLLRAFGLLLRSIINPIGTVYRMDGVRFACSLFGCDKDTVCELYAKIQHAARYNLYVDNTRLSITVSAGAVKCNQNYDEYSVQTSARYALAQSKHKRHGDIVFFDESLLEDNKKNLEIMNTIRESILNGCDGFYLCYQPIMDARHEELIGAEALLRWNKAPFGEVSPGVFIPWLENDPSFYELGNWILRKALREGKGLVEKYPYFVINVNIAYPQLERVSFIDNVKEILEETGYPAVNLCLELTERCKRLDKKYLQSVVNSLKELGIKIAIDDFGTGFSSLELLSELNVDTLKIDRSFMMDIPTNNSNQAIVKAVTSCATDLDINVCLEGLEGREIIDFVKKYAVYSYQGYYFSRPIPIEMFKEKYC